MKKVISSILLAFFAISTIAQQEAMTTFYMYNVQSYNPAYAGSRDMFSAVGIHRAQWTGVDGAPTTSIISANAPIILHSLGAGINIMSDKIGPISSNSIDIDFSYQLKINENSRLSFGAKAGGSILQGNFGNLLVNDGADVEFSNNVRSRFTPNIGFGAYFQSSKFYAGISSPRLIKKNILVKSDDQVSMMAEESHYYGIFGFIKTLTPSLKIRPSTFLKITPGAPIQSDLTVQLILKDKVWGGIMFRTGDSYGALLGWNATEFLQIGYAYDASFGFQPTNRIAGSHEVMLRYELIKTTESRVVSPRYF